MRILVTGGAGYIGSHTCKALALAGHEPVVIDNLSTGHRKAVQWGPFVNADLADTDLIRASIETYRPQAVLHFAAHAYVGESISHPREYFRNNVTNSLNLLDAMVDHGIKLFVFSSSCATYGVPLELPILESHPQSPVNPYGESKLFIERALKWYGLAHGVRSLTLRYFNAAGADPDGQLGEDHRPETHLIPRALLASLTNQPFHIYGTDYPTTDGTCIRDYIHVHDLAAAHVSGVDALSSGDLGAQSAINLGTGVGHSVLEVVHSVERVTGASLPIAAAPRREGDPPVLIAATENASAIRWVPGLSNLNAMIESAWRWLSEHHVSEHLDAAGCSPHLPARDAMMRNLQKTTLNRSAQDSSQHAQ